MTHRQTFQQTQLLSHRPGVPVVAVSTCHLVVAAVAAAVVAETRFVASKTDSRFSAVFQPLSALSQLYSLRGGNRPIYLSEP